MSPSQGSPLQEISILITGSNGFVGQHLVQFLKQCSDFKLRTAGRKAGTSASVEHVAINTIDHSTDWTAALQSIDVVIHLAGITGVPHRDAQSAHNELREVNTSATLNLAHQAANAGVKRFIFLSSIKVCGEGGFDEDHTSYDEAVLSRPQDEYARSKYDAELGLQSLSTKTGMEVVIVRPPLIYGPGAKGNFTSLQNAILKGIPLPLGSAYHNRRSLISIYNLVDFIKLVGTHPRAANETFNICDCDDVSTAGLVEHIALSLNKHPRLIPIPRFLFKWMAAITGKHGLVLRLFGNLRVDTRKANSLLNWTPPYNLEESLKKFEHTETQSGRFGI